MAWCRQATSHYLSQSWPRFMLPYDITRPQWVKNHQHDKEFLTLLMMEMEYFSKLTSPFLFADDTNLFISGNDPHQLSQSLNHELSEMSEWLKVNKLFLNVKKTHYMLLTSKRNQKPGVSIAIDGHSIDEVQYTRFLGVYIDDKLNWKKHIAYISGKVSRGIGLIVKARIVLNASALTTLYYSFIYPFSTYCNHVWGCAYESNLHSLVLLQKRIVRIITSSKYRDHSQPLIERLKLLKIGDINKYVLGKFMFRLYNNEVPTMFHAMFQKVRSVHGYDTRQSNHLYISKVKTNLGKCKLSYRGPMIWNSILAAEINPETSEAVFAKTLKQCIKVGLLRLFDIYFDFDNFYERKKCCDVKN